MGDLVVRAARNNAEWCDIVCRAHGLSPRFDATEWTSEQRTPDGFPDAVTLAAGTDAQRLLDRIDASTGCSVKDSFADLDLLPYGFHVSFDAQWLVGPRSIGGLQTSVPAWEEVEEVDEWMAAHPDALMDGDAMRRVLADSSVTALVARAGHAVVAGGVINHGVVAVGLSNVFVRTGDPVSHWRGALATIRRRYPTLPIVGYELGPMLEAARRAGCQPVGPLRVWVA